MRYFAFAFFVFLITSCATSKKPSRVLEPVRTSTKSPTADNTKDRVDTVQWTILSESEYPPIMSGNILDISPLEREISDVSLLIPFETYSNPDTLLSRAEEKFAHFYGGVLIAINELEEADRSLRINVFDTKRNLSKISEILRDPDIRRSDVVIGPYDIDNLKRVAEWGKANNIPILSPWRSSSNIASENLYYYQLRPLIQQYFEAILRDALNKYETDDIYIITRPGKEDRSKIKVLREIHERINPKPISTPISEYQINVDSLQDSEYMVFESLFVKKDKAALIIPNYSSKDSRFVYSVIRKLNAEIQDQEITIYGMPTLVNVDRLDLEFFRSLNLKTVDFKFTDKENPGIKKFTSSYFEKYGQLPTEDSYHGYDTMILISNKSEAQKYGGSYNEISHDLPLLSFIANFEKYHKGGTSGSSQYSRYQPGDFMVNSSLRLIEFSNNRFRAVEIE